MVGDVGIVAAVQGAEFRAVVIERAEEYLAEAGFKQVYLDCLYGNGILPKYYMLLGFEQVRAGGLTFPGGKLDSVLMRKRLAQRA